MQSGYTRSPSDFNFDFLAEVDASLFEIPYVEATEQLETEVEQVRSEIESTIDDTKSEIETLQAEVDSLRNVVAKIQSDQEKSDRKK